jgi:hypothetical protein
LSTPLTIPGPAAILRHALPNLFVAKVVPVALFVAFLRITGMHGALAVALAWSLGVIVHRRRSGRPVPGLVIVSTVGLVARTVLALATGSLVAYFLQPTLSTALVGLAFLASALAGRPLAERLARDFCPFDAEAASHPMLRLFFLRLSWLWAFTSLVNAAVTLWLLLTQSPTTFVLVKAFLGPLFTAATLAVAVVWFRARMRREGLHLHFGSSMALQVA